MQPLIQRALGALGNGVGLIALGDSYPALSSWEREPSPGKELMLTIWA